MGREFDGVIPDWHSDIQIAKVHGMSTEDLLFSTARTWLYATGAAEIEWQNELQELQSKQK